jgi:hypothetical protein
MLDWLEAVVVMLVFAAVIAFFTRLIPNWRRCRKCNSFVGKRFCGKCGTELGKDGDSFLKVAWNAVLEMLKYWS